MKRPLTFHTTRQPDGAPLIDGCTVTVTRRDGPTIPLEVTGYDGTHRIAMGTCPTCQTVVWINLDAQDVPLFDADSPTLFDAEDTS